MSFQFLQPQLPNITTQTHRYVDTPVSFKSGSRRKQRKQTRENRRANVREISGENNKNLKKKHVQENNSNNGEDIVDDVVPQFIPNNESWYLRMNSISPI